MRNYFKRIVLFLVGLGFSISGVLAYVQTAISCNGSVIYISVPDDMSKGEHNEFIADALEQICDQEQDQERAED